MRIFTNPKLISPSLIFLLGFSSGPSYAVNLNEAVEQAITTNPQVLEQLNIKLSRDYEIRQAKAGYLPSIDLLAGYGSETTDNRVNRELSDNHSRSMNRQQATLILRQMIFDGYETSSEVARQEYRSESANYELINLSQEISVAAIAAYINVLRTQKLVNYAEENVKVHEKIHDQVELRASSGADNQGSLSQIKGRLNLAYSNLEAEKNNLKDALTEYEKVIGGSPEEVLEEASFELELPADYQTALDQALEYHPAIKAAQTDIEERRMQQNTSKSNYYPELELELGSGWADNQDGTRGHDNNHYAMLNVRYNIYQGGADKARVTKDAYLIQEAQSKLDTTRRSVIKAVEIAWSAYQSSNRRLGFLENYVDSTIKTRDAYEQQFRFGERTLLDLLNTENEIFTAQSENIKNEYENIIAKYRVLDAMGTLLNDLQMSVITQTEKDKNVGQTEVRDILQEQIAVR